MTEKGDAMTEHRFRIEEVGDVEDAILYHCTCSCGHEWDVYRDKVTDRPIPWEELCPKCGALDEDYDEGWASHPVAMAEDELSYFRAISGTHKRFCLCCDCQMAYRWKRVLRWLRGKILGR